jgi:short-subunit dehydrogenase
MSSHAVFVTGASKGFGKAVALSFAKSSCLAVPTHFVIASRDVSGLEEVKIQIEERRASLGNDATTVTVIQADLGDFKNLNSFAEKFFSAAKLTSECESITFVNNAGSLGKLGTIGSPEFSAMHLEETFTFNVASSSFLTTKFVEW